MYKGGRSLGIETFANISLLCICMLCLSVVTSSPILAQIKDTPDTTKNRSNNLIENRRESSDTLTIKNESSSTQNDSLKQLSPDELKRLERKRKREIKDSLQLIKDSIRNAQPRILTTYYIPDSLKYKRVIMWRHNQYFNKIDDFLNPDSTYNENFHIYPFRKNDVGATYLGLSGSAYQTDNYFKREKIEYFSAFNPYIGYGYTADNVPFYNTKTPQTELAYWGTLFATRQKSEDNVKFLTTQNLSPSLNVTISYKRYGAKGLLNRERTDNSNFYTTVNYVGKRYVLHAGYINQNISRNENGGVLDIKEVLDTTIKAKAIATQLRKANNKLERNTFFLTHTYGIPIRFSKKDTLKSGDGTITYIGHSLEYSSYYRLYTDNIDLKDSTDRAFYNNKFYINPINSTDSSRVSVFDNKVFIRIQPWAKDAIISNIDGGIGYQMMKVYLFHPEFYIQGIRGDRYNNSYIYFGASGMYRRYLKWDAFSKYNISGYYSGDMEINGNVRLSLYPFDGGIHLLGKIGISNRTPEPIQNYYFSNHIMWNNSFKKITETRTEATIEIPKWNASAFIGYALVGDMLYYDYDGTIKQHGEVVNILSAYVRKDFRLWKFHFENKVLFQISSNQEVIPLPKISANLRYYMQFEAVKNVLTVQIGSDISLNTKYFAPAYNPATGQFQIQKERSFGNTPYIDAFINLQWKSANIFVKLINAAQGWPNNDYFSANRYIKPQRTILLGIHVPFYIR